MQSNVTAHQHVTLFPSYAFFDRSTQKWSVPLSGFVHTSGRDGVGQRVFLRVLKQVLDVDESQLRDNACYRQRIPGFLQDPQGGKTVVVAMEDGALTASGKSGRNGHVSILLPLPPDRVSADWTSQAPQELPRLPYQVVLPQADERQMFASAEVIPPQGVSVISDIDDTLKISQVAHRRQLLHNTFLHDFVPVPGMAQLYSDWKQQGVAFHYVSSSPWQLFGPLQEFMGDNGFPVGSFHLRTYQFRDPSVLKLFMSRKRYKFKIIDAIFNQFPERQFVLVGDSGEKDAEVYGKVARRHPNQVHRILIRRVDGRPWTRKRVEKAFRGVPEDSWQTFHVPTQIRDLTL